MTFAALVLGLLVTTIKTRFDSQADTMQVYASNLIQFDQRLEEYGPDSAQARALLRAYTAAAVFNTWPDEARPPGNYPVMPTHDGDDAVENRILGSMLQQLDREIRQWSPSDRYHRDLMETLLTSMSTLMRTRWTLIETAHATISWPFLILLVLWLMIVFAMFGLISPRNRVVYATVLCCSLSVTSAVFLVLDFDTPYDGPLKLSSQPMRSALSHMDAASE
ncbi:MAG TPA: hypothetical protein VIG49_08415 [Acetobacteraceae bacterium]